MLAPSHTQGAALIFPACAIRANSHNFETLRVESPTATGSSLRAAPAFLSPSFPFADVSGCGFVALTGPLFAPGPTRTLKGTPAGRHRSRAYFVKGDYTKPSDIKSQTQI